MFAVSRIKTETGTSIIIPSDTEKSDVIRIEGDPVGVKAAKTMLLELAAKMVNFATIVIRGYGFDDSLPTHFFSPSDIPSCSVALHGC